VDDWRDLRLPGLGPDRTAIVLGAGGAIGRETVAAFTALGVRTALVTRDRERSARLAERIGGTPYGADLSDTPALERLADDVTGALGPPTILVNCAALGSSSRSVLDLTRAEISAIFDANVAGALEAIRAAVPAMRDAGGGSIVNLASIAAYRASSSGPAYGSSKAAIIALTGILAAELGPHHIRVNSVSPGQTPTLIRTWDGEPGAEPEETAGSAGARAVPLGRRGRLADYVGAILYLCSDLAGYVTGVDIPVEGGVRLVRARAATAS
jgi:NAD(P)-dependent dehydrogenase (short-subunit alcohol dehydrogenase family)